MMRCRFCNESNFSEPQECCGWISVKDQHPLLYEKVLVSDGKEFEIGHITMDNSLEPYWLSCLYGDPTHWMKLPDLPSSDSEHSEIEPSKH